MADELQNITMNLAPVVRHETLNGRDYIVAPMVMLTVGVHNGSNGPLYYPRDELAKTPVVWNMKPIVVYHPTQNGQGVTATDPDVLATQSVGMVMHAKFDGKLRAEAWLERDRLEHIDPRIVETLESGQLMEVSTGLFTDNVYEPGSHGGSEYEMVARNFRPDHLAILPDKVGACSIQDGAGLLQLNEAGDIPETLGVPAATALRDRLEAYITNHGSGGGTPQSQTKGGGMTLAELADGLIENEATTWVEDDREFLEGQTPEALEKFVPVEVENKKYGDKKPPVSEDEEEEKKNMPKAPLKNDNPDTPPEAQAAAPPARAVTVDEYIAAAPEGIRDMLSAGLAAHNAEKAELIAGITGNAANTYTQEQLGAKDLAELQQLHQLAAVVAPAANVQPLYGGQAVPTGNAAPTKAEAGLPVPVMTFD
jgi:hypothetical protein